MSERKLEICREVRSFAANALLEALNQTLDDKKPISERAFRDTWLQQLRQRESIFLNGWYTPPPHGVGVLFGTSRQIERVSPKSMRPQEFWPRDDVILDRNDGIALFYISPVDRETGVIGDFGLTAYFGTDQKVRRHLRSVYDIARTIFNFVQIGQEFKETVVYCHELLGKRGLYTDLASPSDPAGTNIGHTIPFSYEDMSEEERELLLNANNDWEGFKNMLSKKRRFVSNREDMRVKPGMAFTIEPRPQSKTESTIPMVWFHTIALIHDNGNKELLTNFDEVFKIVGMDYMRT